MIVHCFPVGQLETNCYLAYCSRTNEGIVVDPGDEGSFLSEKIKELKIKLKLIIATHGHFDHILAAEELRLNFQIPLLIHQEDLFLLKKAGQSAEFWLQDKEKFLLPQKARFIEEGEKIRFGQEELKVIHTPGHTPGSIALYSQKENLLFSGDLLFQEGVGRTDFSYSSPEKLEQSLRKVFSLPSQTLVYPGHGKAFTLEKRLS